MNHDNYLFQSTALFIYKSDPLQWMDKSLLFNIYFYILNGGLTGYWEENEPFDDKKWFLKGCSSSHHQAHYGTEFTRINNTSLLCLVGDEVN